MQFNCYLFTKYYKLTHKKLLWGYQLKYSKL